MIERILIVDDSPIIHSLLGKALRKNGYEVCGDAKNGREALELFEQVKPDLVFMDVTMPVMDGLAAAKELKARHPGSHIIMLTAMGDEEMMRQAAEAGVDIFLKKPFNEYKIVSAISGLTE